MTYKIVRGGWPIADHLGEVLFEPRDGGTDVTWRCRFRSRVPGLGGLIRFGITRDLPQRPARPRTRPRMRAAPRRAATWSRRGMIRGLLELLGGLGLLLFGLRTVSEALQVLFGERLRRRVAEVGNGRRAEFDVGVVAGLITQSSAAAAVRIVSFVNAGLMSLTQAAGVLVGANLGATVPAWLLALQPGRSALGLLGIGASVHLLADASRCASPAP